jgi:cytochrome c oxidase subunit IV
MSSTHTESHAGHGDHDSPEAIRASIKKYLMVGGVLYVLTVVTYLVSFIDLAIGPTIALGLAVATTKASLVALFFMHLIDEKRLIYYTLALTALFFALCMILPSATTHSSTGETHRTDIRAPSLSHGSGDHGKTGDHGGDHKKDDSGGHH